MGKKLTINETDKETGITKAIEGEWVEITSRIKVKGCVFDIKHFENGTDGNQLLTTGTFDFINDTYKCTVRVIKD